MNGYPMSMASKGVRNLAADLRTVDDAVEEWAPLSGGGVRLIMGSGESYDYSAEEIQSADDCG